MAINNLSLGPDITLNIHTPTGQITIPTVVNFMVNPTPEVRKSVGINGNILFAPIPLGYNGSMEIDRTSPAMEQFWTDYESQYYAGVNLQSSTITVTVREADGGITQWLISGVMFDAQAFGNWSGTDFVKQTLKFNAAKYKQLL